MNRYYASFIAALALSLASCAKDGSQPFAQNDRYNNNGVASGQGDGASEASARSSDELRARSTTPHGDTTQLQHGNDKTTVGVALSAQDRTFLQDATSGNSYEIEAGQKALDKSSSPRVKTIAQRIIDDHTIARRDLSALAKRKGVEVATLPSADQIKLLARLDELNGGEFDKEYINQQRTAHQDTIGKFTVEAQNGTDSDVKFWSAQMLPTLQAHLNMINEDKSADVSAQN